MFEWQWYVCVIHYTDISLWEFVDLDISVSFRQNADELGHSTHSLKPFQAVLMKFRRQSLTLSNFKLGAENNAHRSVTDEI